MDDLGTLVEMAVMTLYWKVNDRYKNMETGPFHTVQMFGNESVRREAGANRLIRDAYSELRRGERGNG